MVDKAHGRFYFNTDSLPEGDRFPAFCEEIFRRIIAADIVRLDSSPFHGMLSVRRAGMVRIADVATTPIEMNRSSSHTRDGNDDIFVQLWRQGSADATQGERQCKVIAGEGLVIDNGRAARIFIRDASRFTALSIPRDRIVRLHPHVDRLAGTKLQDALPVRLLLGYLEGTLAQDLDDQPAAQLFGDHLVDLVALGLSGEHDAWKLEERSGVRAARCAMVLQMIAQQSTDHGLSALTIAAQMGITPRYVHLLLEETGQSFTQHLLEMRLERAAALLRDPRRQRSRIAEIALESGFADLSQFNRAFRRRFGDTPSGVRANAPARNTPKPSNEGAR